ncbi:MAG: dockerin type I repeat-containing protein [Prevotella sp.]|nr:dockerin type I repeat-containing protein [Prevotella sp.]
MVCGQKSAVVINLTETKPDTCNALTFSLLLPEGFNLEGEPQPTRQWANAFCVTQENITYPAHFEKLGNIQFYACGDMDDQNRSIKMAFASANELSGTKVDSLLTIGFKVNENIGAALYTIKLQDILFEYYPKGKVNANDVTVRVRIWKLGDADRNGEVNVADATDAINHILERSSEEYNVMLADMNEDKIVDIFDVMKLINVILTGKLPASDNSLARSDERSTYEDLTLAFTQDGVTINVPNAQRFTSFQFDMEVADDVEMTEAKLIGSSTNHTVQFAKVDDNCYRVVGLSLDNSLLTSNNTNGLIGINIPNCEKIRISYAMFVNPQGKMTYFNDIETESGITGIRNANMGDTESVYDLLGRKVKNDNKNLHKGIYIINNKRVVVK